MSCKTLQKVASFVVTINGLSKIYKVNSQTKKGQPWTVSNAGA